MKTTLPRRPVVGAWPAYWIWEYQRPNPMLPPVWAPVPAAVKIDHGGHELLVMWAAFTGAPEARLFTLDSLAPLTVVEEVTCSICGVTGRIEQGAWLPAKDGQRG